MSEELKNLELEIERDLARFGPRLDVAPLSRERIQAMTLAVTSEVARVRAVRRLFGLRTGAFGGAAAILLAFAVGWIQNPPAASIEEPTVAAADQFVDDWMSAVAGSSEQLSAVVQRSWSADESSSDSSGEDAVDSFLESFERIETMTGV